MITGNLFGGATASQWQVGISKDWRAGLKERNIEATAERELNNLKGDAAAAAARDPQFRLTKGREYASSSKGEEKDDDKKQEEEEEWEDDESMRGGCIW